MAVFTPIVLGEDATVVRRRLARGLLPIRSTWFPTPRELSRWNRSTHPLYVRWLGRETFELGPRLSSLQAASFCPVLRGRLVSDASGGTRIEGTVRLPSLTRGLFGFWGAVLIAWLFSLVQEPGPGELTWWFILLGFTMSAAGLAHVYGTRELRSGLERLPALLAEQELGEDDW